MKFKPTIIQRMAYPAIMWIIGGPLGSGKTTILCYCFIQHAIKTGEWVKPFTHITNPDYSAYAAWSGETRRTIEFLYNEYFRDNYSLEIKVTSMSFRMISK